MARFWQVFLRVLRTYSIEEKVISIIAVTLVLVSVIHGGVEIFKTPGLFSEGGIYSEGIVNSQGPQVILNPVFFNLSDANRDISSLVFSGLTKYDPKVKAFVPDLANVSISEDKKTYRFTLKDNIKWHDGEPLTIDDVYYTYHDVIENPDFHNQSLQANFSGVEIKKVDEKSIEFTLNSPNSFFITNTNVGILPKHLLETVAVADLVMDPFNIKPIGTGPYRIDTPMESFNDGRQRVILSAYDKYYGELPKIKNIRFNIYPDDASLLKEQNANNVIAKVPREIQESLEMSGRFSFKNFELPQYTAVFFNMDSPVLRKEKVRLALQKAVDKSQLLALFTRKIAVDTPLMELQQTDWIYKPNIDEAKGSMYDAGYKLPKEEGAKYRKDADGKEVEIKLLARQFEEGTTQADETQKTIDFLVKSWEAIGVKVTAQIEPKSSFDEKLQARDYDMILTGQSMGYNFDTYSFWHSSQAEPGGLNLSNYRSFAVDSLIEHVRDTFDNEKKTDLLTQLAKEISLDNPAIFLYRPSYVFGTDGKVKNIGLEDLAFPADRFAHVNEWCINCPVSSQPNTEEIIPTMEIPFVEIPTTQASTQQTAPASQPSAPATQQASTQANTQQ